jgi:hypothetical protein
MLFGLRKQSTVYKLPATLKKQGFHIINLAIVSLYRLTVAF